MFSHQNKKFVLCSAVTLALFSGACVTPTVYPNVDLVLAREAFNSAGEVEAAKYSPASYHIAEETFRRAMVLYNDGSYEEAIESFKLARSYAEKAENSARVQRQKAGEEGL